MKKILLILVVLGLGMFLGGCTSQNNESQNNVSEEGDKITLTSKPFTENYIMGEMMAILLEEKTDLNVTYLPIEGGTTSVLHPAMLKGEIDIYAEYTGTGWQEVLKRDKGSQTPVELYELVKNAYEQEYDIVWLEPFGFNDTFTLAVEQSFATENNISSFSDLASLSGDLRFGSEPDFYERKDGYDGLVATYNFKFKDARQMAIALKYNAISNQEVDVINAFSTDGLLKQFNLVVLQDDKNYFPSYLCAPVVRGETLRKHPEIKEVLGELAGLIDETVMTDLNYQVDEMKKEPKVVAREFLQSHGLVK